MRRLIAVIVLILAATTFRISETAATPTVQALGTMTYPGVDARFHYRLTHSWPLKTNGVDVLNGSNVVPLSPFAPACTFNGSTMHAADHCLEYRLHSGINPHYNDFAVCGSMITDDGHYNLFQVNTARNTIPWGFVKLTGYAFIVSGTLAQVVVPSGLYLSDGVKHYLCGQRIGNTFSMIVDGKTVATRTKVVGDVDFTTAGGSNELMIGGKYERQPGYLLAPTDMFSGFTWNWQWAEVVHR